MRARTYGLVLLLMSVAVGSAEVETQSWTVELTTKANRGPSPLIAVWLETADGKFVKTIKRCGKKTKYFKKLYSWRRAAKGEQRRALDAVTGATVKWGRSCSFNLPITTDAYDLSKGGYVLWIESKASKKGGKNSFKVTIGKDFKGGEFTHDGHVSKVTIAKTE